MSNLIHSRAERERIKAEKESKILAFLSEETFTTSMVIAELLNVTQSAAYRTLKKMTEEELISRHEVGYDVRKGGRQVIWGLTPTGALLAADVESEDFKIDYYEAGRVKQVTMAHSLDLQYIKVQGLAKGWTKWISSRKLLQEAQKNRAEWLQIPDAFAISPKGYHAAIEVERTIKTPKRYVEILSNYATMINQNKIDMVIYISPSDRALRLKKLFSSIEKINVNGVIHPVSESLLNRFKFMTYEEWEQA